MAVIRVPSDASRITRSTNNAAWLTRPCAQSQSSGAAAYPKGGFITMTSAFGSRREGSRESPTIMLGNAPASTPGVKGRTDSGAFGGQEGQSGLGQTDEVGRYVASADARSPCIQRTGESRLHRESEGDCKKQVASTACRIEIGQSGGRPGECGVRQSSSPTWHR